MNKLPEHRQILWGRTHGKTWEPADADPLTFYPGAHKLLDVAMATIIGAALAIVIVYSF